MQRALIQYRNPANRELVLEALKKANRMDLVGYDKKCLIRPDRNQPVGYGRGKKGKQNNDGNVKTSVRKRTIRNVHKKKK